MTQKISVMMNGIWGTCGSVWEGGGKSWGQVGSLEGRREKLYVCVGIGTWLPCVCNTVGGWLMHMENVYNWICCTCNGICCLSSCTYTHATVVMQACDHFLVSRWNTKSAIWLFHCQEAGAYHFITPYICSKVEICAFHKHLSLLRRHMAFL